MKTSIISITYDRIEGSRLTVLANIKEQGRSNHRVFCVCECGNFCYKVKSKVLTLHTRSCGCLVVEKNKKLGENRKLENNQAAINKLWQSYNSSARNRGLVFDLNFDLFLQLTQQPCHYCLSPPSRLSKAPFCDNPYPYNGIDRLNNSIGYTTDNVVSCCTMCNKIKSTFTIDELFDHLIRIRENLVNDKI